MAKGGCRPVFTFGKCRKDADFYRCLSAEQHYLYYNPRRWLVNDDTITLNIYGEPGSPLSGTDGVTSVPATRRFTSAAVDFVAAGVLAGDILEIASIDCDHEDNGRYQIDTVVDANNVDITEDWPQGSLTSLPFNVYLLPERYTEFGLVPFLVKLNPTEKTLDQWGITEKRDAMVVMSIELCQRLGLVPKIGDRFVYDYGMDPTTRENRSIHYEVKNLFPTDQIADTGTPIHYVGFATRTTNRLPTTYPGPP
jgi:hypothetical protein